MYYLREFKDSRNKLSFSQIAFAEFTELANKKVEWLPGYCTYELFHVNVQKLSSHHKHECNIAVKKTGLMRMYGMKI